MSQDPKHTALPSPASLRAAVQVAVAKGEPLVLMTTLVGCPYCDLVRNHYLLPMRRAGQVQAVQLDIRDRRSNLQDFAGNTTTRQIEVATASLAAAGLHFKAPNTFCRIALPVPTGSWRILRSSSPMMV